MVNLMLLRQIFKASLAYTIAISLIMTLRFSSLVEFPIVLTAAVLVAVAGKPGSTVGQLFDAVFWGALGVLTGALWYYLIAITPSRIGQGFIFLVAVFGYSYTKSLSMRYFAFSLLGIVVSFAGIYTSVLSGGFVAGYLKSYLIAYAFGFAIVLAVNLLVFPATSESLLRATIVTSLEHARELAHLTSKGFDQTLSDEETSSRDALYGTCRADYGYLSAQLSETFLEINYSRFSWSDYAQMVESLRNVQRGLISTFSAVVRTPKGTRPAHPLSVDTFRKLRQATNLIVDDILIELSQGTKHHTVASRAAGSKSWEELLSEHSVDSSADSDRSPPRPSPTVVAQDQSVPAFDSSHEERERKRVESEEKGSESASLRKEEPIDRVAFARAAWLEFETHETDLVTNLLANGIEGDPKELLLDTKLPVGLEPRTSNAEAVASRVMTSFAFLKGLSKVINELTSLHEHVRTPRKRRIHIHLFERIAKPVTSDSLSLQQALAVLSGVEYVKPRVPFFRRFAELESSLRSETILFSIKVAVAVSVLAVFALAPSLKLFFIDYALTGGIITLVVALSPTLGQTIFVFALQILGVAAGNIYGLIALEIARGHGYTFNPYILATLLGLFSIPLSWVIYARPPFFAFGLLALNGAGTIAVTEFIYRDVASQLRPTFDTPALRAGKALVSMSIALVIAAAFQLFILRTPARHTLRVKLAQVTFQLSSYNLLLQALVHAIVPYDGDTPSASSPEAIGRVYRELVAREQSIQSQILSLYPLIKFSSVEFDFGRPFNGKVYNQLLRSHQTVLDRLTESRSSFEHFDAEEDFLIHLKFSAVLAPYRKQARRFSRALFYLCATSLETKRPLPQELPSMATIGSRLAHDALILSHRLTLNETTKHMVQSRGFLSYWAFLASYSAVGRELQTLEDLLRVLFEVAGVDQFHL